jgi:hypothetical protein
VKIYDEKNDRLLQSVTIYLTPDEMHELADSARNLFERPECHHGHITNQDFSVEVTIAVYTRENLAQFDARSREILGEEFG